MSASPIEIAVITHYYADHGGGIERVTERMIREISRDPALHFVWIASDSDPPPVIEGQAMMPMRSWNISEKYFGLPLPLWSPRSFRRMKDAIAKADIVWLHDLLYPGNMVALRAAKRMGKPVIVNQHIAPIPYRNPLKRLLMRWADGFFTSRLLPSADEVIFISDRVADFYYEKIPFTRPIKVIPNGVDIRIFHPAMAENRRFLREQFALKPSQPVLLFVGRFTEKKGLDVIKNLAQLLPTWRFWLAGSGANVPEKWFLPNVHVLRNRKGPALAELYQAADLLIMPSYGEGFPLVVQEAMACGLPVLCSPETAQGNAMARLHLHTAPVWPKDPARTAKAWLEKLKAFPLTLPLSTPQDLLAEHALLSWDWPPIAKVYADIFKKCIQSAKPSPFATEEEIKALKPSSKDSERAA
ncbi:MAG: glycosyltransferase family 4 protein [Alphaproteobacteria bacterium]|nr:glycosyltransferase family 4 protein [Alphaproteobacteria bacterium]